MKSHQLLTYLTAAGALLSSLTCHGSVIFDSTTWYAATASSLSVDSGTMSLPVGGGNTNGNFALTYLTTAGSYDSLNVGDSMTLTVSFSELNTVGASATGLRFGLLNSGNNRISTDGAGVSNAKYTNYTGYATAFGSNSATTSSLSSAIWKRTGANSALISTSGVYTAEVSSTATVTTGSKPAMPADTQFTISMKLDYLSASDLRVTTTLNGPGLGSGFSQVFDDTSSLVTGFDTIALYSTSSFTPNVLTISSVTVVPEPSAGSSLLGGLGLVALVLFVRRCRASTAHSR